TCPPPTSPEPACTGPGSTSRSAMARCCRASRGGSTMTTSWPGWNDGSRGMARRTPASGEAGWIRPEEQIAQDAPRHRRRGERVEPVTAAKKLARPETYLETGRVERVGEAV